MSQVRYRKPIAVIAALSLVVGLFPTGALAEITRETFDQQQVSDIAANEKAVGGQASAEGPNAEGSNAEGPTNAQTPSSVADESPEVETQGEVPADTSAAVPTQEPPAVLAAQANSIIGSVSLIVTPPDAGMSSSVMPTVSVPVGASYSVGDAGWYNADGSEKKPTDPDFEFEAGKTYKFYVDVMAADDKDFADSATAAVSGGTLAGPVDVYNSPDSNLSALTAYITVTVTAKHGTYTDESGVQFSYKRLEGGVQGQGDICAITQIYLPNDAAAGSVDVEIPSAMEGLTVTSLGADDDTMTLENTNRMRSLTIPASVEAICGPYFKYQRYQNDTSNLATVTFEEGSKVTRLPSELFANSGLASITLPSGLTAIDDSAFSGCKKLAAIDMPARVRTIGDKAFYNCTALTDIKLREGLASIGSDAFASDNGDMTYTTVALPDSVESIGEYAFSSDSLTSVSLGTSMAESHLSEIGAGAFAGTSLTSVEIPNSVESIGEHAFACKFDRGVGGKGHGVSTLQSVTFGTSQADAQLQTIGPNAFAGSALTAVTLPNSLQALETTETYGMTYSGEYLTEGPFSQSPLLETIVWPTSPSSPMASLIEGFNGCEALPNSTISSLPTWASTIGAGAFSNCNFTAIEIPAGITQIGPYAFAHTVPESITFSEEGGALTIGEHAFALDVAWGIGNVIVGEDMVIDLPLRVESVGAQAFAGLRVASDSGDKSPTFVIHNPAIEVGAAEEEWPIEAAKGATVRYPADAGESFMAFKAAVEAYEATLDEGTFNPTVFEVAEEELPPAVQHTITVTAPAGATMQLAVNGDDIGEPVTTSPLTAKADEGSQVAVVISMDGYKDFIAQPEGGWLAEDWTCAVAESDLTPLSDTGSITVALVKEGKATQRDQVAALVRSTVAVFDSKGRLVAQDKASTSLVLHFGELASGAYTVVAFEKNDYFSAVNSLDDFARLGVKEGSWAVGKATVKPAKDTEVALSVPDLQLLAADEILESGSVIVPNSVLVPSYAFYVRIDYAMKDGHVADTLTVSVPAGIELESGAYTKDSSYGTDGFDAANRQLTINLKGVDRQSGSLYVGMKVVEAGNYNIGASVASGTVTAPVGSASVEAPALRLLTPETQLDSPEFPVAVHASPGSTVRFKIGDTELDTVAAKNEFGDVVAASGVVTNKLGVATATLTIPEAERLNSYVSIYGVTALLLDSEGNVVAEASSAIDFPPTHVVGSSVREWELSFAHAGQEVFLVKDGEVLPDVYYTCVMGTHIASLFSPTWPFKSVFDSEKPLADTARLTLKMLDGTVSYSEMKLAGVETLSDGTLRHTYTADVKIGSGRIDLDLTARDIPCGFEVTPSFADEHFERPEITPRNMRDLAPWFTEPLTVRVNWDEAAETTGVKKGEETDFYYQYAPDAYAYLLDQGIDMETGNVLGVCVFGDAYKHEVWDADGSVWKGLTAEERQNIVEFEDAMDSFLKAWQQLMGTEKPMNEYDGLEDYLNDAYGHETGTGVPDPETLEAEGWQVCHNGGAVEGDDSDWYATRFTPSDDFGNDVANGGDLTKYKDKVDPTSLTNYGNDMINNGDTTKYQDLVDPTKPVDPGKGSGTIECIQAKDNTFDKINRKVNDVPSVVVAAVAEGQNQLGQKISKAAPIMQQSGRTAGAKVAAGASKVVSVTSIATTVVQMHQNHITMAQLDNRLYDYGWRSLDLARDLTVGDIVDTECGRAMILEGLGLLGAGYFNLQRRTFLTVDNVVGAETTALSYLLAENPAASSLLSKVGTGWTFVSQLGDNFIYKPLANYSKSVLDKLAAQREEDCIKGRRTAHGANVIVDPSGWVYEAVDENRLEGVTATVYELIDNVWQNWNASLYNQVNGQTTGSWGIFGWDVPQGTWKITFHKDGYDDATAIIDGSVKAAAETDPMDVLPQYRNIAVGLVSKQAPAVVATTVDDDGIVVEFSQYMKASTLPVVKIDDSVATPTWVDPVEGTNAQGEKEPMAKSLRIPLPKEAEPADVLHVVLTGGVNYAGTPFTSGEAYVTVPGEAPSYYYEQPAADPVFTKGSTAGLDFTFKRTINDQKTFPNFTGAEVDGKALERDKDYKAVEGSVVITLDASYLETLSEAEHTLTAQFEDGEAQATFTVKAAASEGESAPTKPASSSTANKPNSSTTSKSSTAKTGDAVPVAALALAVAASAVVLLVTRLRPKPARGKHANR